MHLNSSNNKEFYLEEIEKLERQRAEERASLRHKNKNKYTKLLKKYADKKVVQNVYKDLNF